MIEVPALVEVLEQMTSRVSFLSVGTNDLTQFLFAADRANPKLAQRYDWLSPAILRFLKRITRGIDGSDVDLAVCGEMGGRRLEALALLGIGFRRLSITPAAVGPIKELICKVDLDEITAAMNDWLANPPASMRGAIQEWASQRGITTE
jgi:phosphotransferase system enzyme I (PtsP)